MWPLEKKIEVVTQYLVLGNLKLVAATTGVDYGVIRQWRIQPWWKDLEVEIRATQNIELDNKLSKIVERSMAVTLDRLENGEHVLNNKTGELIRKPVAMKDAAKVASDFMSRQALLRKEDRQEDQVTQVAVADQLKTLAAEFAKWATKKAQNSEAVDIEVKEVEDAISEEREETVQTGTRMGAQDPSEPSEGSSGEELSQIGDGESREST